MQKEMIMHDKDIVLGISKESVIVKSLEKQIEAKVIIENFYMSGDGSASMGLDIVYVIDSKGATIANDDERMGEYNELINGVIYGAACTGMLDGVDGVVGEYSSIK